MKLQLSTPQSVAPIPAIFGVDVSSEHLDAAAYGHDGVHRLANTDKAIDKWLAKLASSSVIALESTGHYHLRLAHAAHAKGLTVYVLNPRDVRHYAKALGSRGKTDRLDAQLLARYADRELKDLRPWTPPSAESHRLNELLRRRGVLVKHHQAVKKSVKNSVFDELAEPLMTQFDALLDVVDTQIAQAAADLSLDSEAFERITSVPGIGLLTGSALLTVFQRLAQRGADSVIAFLGMDMRPADSGKKIGQRRMTKRGPAEWRRLLFNAAKSAARTTAWRAHYQRERDKGLSTTAAFNILARKLVRVAFSLFKSNQFFSPQTNALP